MSSRESNSSSSGSCDDFSRKRFLVSASLELEKIEPYVRRKRSNSVSSKNADRSKKRLNNLNDKEQNIVRTSINSRERRRMHDLNSALDDLRRVIPHSENSNLRKMSKITTVVLATNLICKLTTEIKELKAQNKDVDDKNFNLLQQNLSIQNFSSIDSNINTNLPKTYQKKPSLELISKNLLTSQISFTSRKNTLSEASFYTQQNQQQQQQYQQLQQQSSSLPYFLASTIQNMAATAVYANCRNQFQNHISETNNFNEKIKSAFQLRQMALASATASMINNTKNISPDFLPKIENLSDNKTNSFLTSSTFDIIKSSPQDLTESNVKDINFIKKTNSQKHVIKNNSHKSTRENTPYNIDVSLTPVCQRRNLLSSTVSPTAVCLCVSCLLSSKVNSFIENKSNTNDDFSKTSEGENNTLFTLSTTTAKELETTL